MFTLKRKALSMPSAAEALPGRSQALPTAKTHFVTGAALKGPYPQDFATAQFVEQPRQDRRQRDRREEGEQHRDPVPTADLGTDHISDYRRDTTERRHEKRRHCGKSQLSVTSQPGRVATGPHSRTQNNR